jgi:SAM-dependent methyltransferase
MNYDKDYYERGIQTGKSCYENYRWIPELTIPLAHELARTLFFARSDKILDYGCAKGYLVKALRLLHYKAWGVDSSTYAIKHAPADVKKYLHNAGAPPLYDFERLFRHHHFDWIIAKDVFEHLSKEYLEVTLNLFVKYVPNMCVIVPLGQDNKYNAASNNLDPTHVICEGIQWWVEMFAKVGYQPIEYGTKLDYIKPAYKDIDYAHGFLKLKRY